MPNCVFFGLVSEYNDADLLGFVSEDGRIFWFHGEHGWPSDLCKLSFSDNLENEPNLMSHQNIVDYLMDQEIDPRQDIFECDTGIEPIDPEVWKKCKESPIEEFVMFRRNLDDINGTFEFYLCEMRKIVKKRLEDKIQKLNRLADDDNGIPQDTTGENEENVSGTKVAENVEQIYKANGNAPEAQTAEGGIYKADGNAPASQAAESERVIYKTDSDEKNSQPEGVAVEGHVPESQAAETVEENPQPNGTNVIMDTMEKPTKRLKVE